MTIIQQQSGCQSAQAGRLPSPGYIGLTGAGDHDGKVFDLVRPELTNKVLYGDNVLMLMKFDKPRI